MVLIGQGKKIAVLSVDPSSPVSGGSLLADKTRMSKLGKSLDAFLRPSPSSLRSGGINPYTYETLSLVESFGFDFIFVETVGVGQSEFDIKYICDYFVLLEASGSGDELQAIKKGILELANLIVVTKDDQHGAVLAKVSLATLEKNFRSKKDLEILSSSVQKPDSIRKIADIISRFFEKTSTEQLQVVRDKNLQKIFEKILFAKFCEKIEKTEPFSAIFNKLSSTSSYVELHFHADAIINSL